MILEVFALSLASQSAKRANVISSQFESHPGGDEHYVFVLLKLNSCEKFSSN